MNKDELINDPAIRLAVLARRAARAERTGARPSRISIEKRKWTMLLVLAIIIVLIGVLVLSQIDARELFPLHVDFVSKQWS